MQIGLSMKTTTIPSLRVSPELRKKAEDVLEQGETLSGFVLDALTRSIENRKSRQAFIARGLSNAAQAKKTGKYVPAGKVIKKLAHKLVKAENSSFLLAPRDT
jgi:predicted transcriptional regulator